MINPVLLEAKQSDSLVMLYSLVQLLSVMFAFAGCIRASWCCLESIIDKYGIRPVFSVSGCAVLAYLHKRGVFDEVKNQMFADSDVRNVPFGDGNLLVMPHFHPPTQHLLLGPLDDTHPKALFLSPPSLKVLFGCDCRPRHGRRTIENNLKRRDNAYWGSVSASMGHRHSGVALVSTSGMPLCTKLDVAAHLGRLGRPFRLPDYRWARHAWHDRLPIM